MNNWSTALDHNGHPLTFSSIVLGSGRKSPETCLIGIRNIIYISIYLHILSNVAELEKFVANYFLFTPQLLTAGNSLPVH